MIEIILLGAFISSFIVCFLLHISEVFGLLFGFFLFTAYGIYKGQSLYSLMRLALKGMAQIRSLLLCFILIGMLTGIWRACGTLPWLIAKSSSFLNPVFFLAATFLLTGLTAYLSGSSFGAAASIGAACAMIGRSFGISPLLIGGAVLSGCYFSDRCSPVAASVLLTCQLTGENVSEFISKQMKNGFPALIVTFALFILFGFLQNSSAAVPETGFLFEGSFVLSAVCLLPAAVIFVFSAFHAKSTTVLAASVGCAAVIALLVQNVSISEMIHTMIYGYQSPDPQAAALLDGGGILSMIKVMLVVSISSAFPPMFEASGFLRPFQSMIIKNKDRMPSFYLTLCVSAVCCLLFTSQTLSIMMVHSLMQPLHMEPQTEALEIGDSAVLMTSFNPLSISCTVPLTSIGCPIGSLMFAFYLYLIPIFHALKKQHALSSGNVLRQNQA